MSLAMGIMVTYGSYMRKEDALESSVRQIEIFETMVSIIIEKFKLSRIVATFVGFVFLIILGMTSVFGYGMWSNVTIMGYQFLDFYDFISNNIIMPIVALITCILIGYFAKTKFVEDEVLLGEDKFNARKMYKVMVLVVCPICMIVILLTPFITSI